MPVLDPPESWEDGPLTKELMNTRIRDKIRQLQTGLPRGILKQYVTADTYVDSSGGSPTNVGQWSDDFVVDSPRYLAANIVAAISLAGNSSTPSLMVLQVSFNGNPSINTQMRLEAVGGVGLLIPNMTGSAILVPAGNVSVRATVSKPIGSGDGQMNNGAKLQIIDMGGA